jgi:hypothetical protein
MFFVTYADNRELRKQMAIALAPKAFKTTNLTIRKMLKLPNCDLIAQVLLIMPTLFLKSEWPRTLKVKHSLPTNAKAKPAAMRLPS